VTDRGATAPRPSHAAPRRPEGRSSTIVAFVSALLASACTTLPPPSPTSVDTLSGRLALRVEALGSAAPRAFSAAFDLRGDARSGTLGLSTPLGSTLAEARWSPAEVVLATPQGTRRFSSLDELTREALGESVPIEAWFDWLRGRPWPGAPSEASAASPQGFAQLGWRVDLAGFEQGTVAATRESPQPTVTVRIRLDRS
jgi:outer membrane lipoprotein LolB